VRSNAAAWFTVVVAALAAFFVWRGLPRVVDDVRARFWPTTMAQITSVAERDDTIRVPTRRGGGTVPMAVPHLYILYAFSINALRFAGSVSTNDSDHNRAQFRAGHSLTVHYDRSNPSHNAVVLSFPLGSWFSVLLGIVLAFVSFELGWPRGGAREGTDRR
jgi:hypothetical protein